MIFTGTFSQLVVLLFTVFVYAVFGAWGLAVVAALILLSSRR